jgi:predicted permease
MSRRFNWPLWSGFVLSVAALLSYFLFFMRFPSTRDAPWATLALFAIAIGLLILGLRRATGRRILPWIVTVLGIGIAALFCAGVMMAPLPKSENATAVGAKAPDFVLFDPNRHPVALAQLLATPGTKGVMLVFYRGYW